MCWNNRYIKICILACLSSFSNCRFSASVSFPKNKRSNFSNENSLSNVSRTSLARTSFFSKSFFFDFRSLFNNLGPHIRFHSLVSNRNTVLYLFHRPWQLTMNRTGERLSRELGRLLSSSKSNSCTLHNFKIYVPKMCLVFALKTNELIYRILFNVYMYNAEQQKFK